MGESKRRKTGDPNYGKPSGPAKLNVVPKPEPGTRTVMMLDHPGPFISGSGSYSAVCGNCENLLINRVAPGQVSGIVIRCGKCQAYNETDGKAQGSFYPGAVN